MSFLLSLSSAGQVAARIAPLARAGTAPSRMNKTRSSPLASALGLARNPCRGTAVRARQRNLYSTARIENVKDGAIRNRLTGTLLDSFGQQTFEFFKVGNFGTHIL